MNKFQKRITKSIKKSPIDCLIVGDGFGHADDLIEMFNTVFVLHGTIQKKARNLVMRKDANTVFQLRDVAGIFISLDRVNHIEELSPLLSSSSPDIFVEGNEVLERTHTKVLYQLGYRAIAQLNFCHQWSRVS
jgi:hypothetical protein